MCGIVGWSLGRDSRLPESAVLYGFRDALAHRGPDGEGAFFHEESHVALGHRRLSIIDLSASNSQPMTHADTKIVLSFNGEIYNFRELRAELEACGHTFRTAGDTEVLLNAYITWGVAAFSRLCGMFALSIWDPRTQTLHLARDAMGIKPLYYTEFLGGLAFASELKAFAQLPGKSLQLCEQGLQQYLEFGYVFDETRTIIEGVRKLAPGERLEIRAGKIVARSNFFVPPRAEQEQAMSLDDRVEQCYALLHEVVEQHLIADVPVATLLSGGIDSSIVAALAAKRGKVETLTMAFSESDVDERPYAKLVSDHLGAKFDEIVISPEQVVSEVENGAAFMDDLFSDWGTVTSKLLYRKCREKGYKVVLVGEGADELFGGYEIFSVSTRLNLVEKFQLYRRYAGRRYGRLFGEFRRALASFSDHRNCAFDQVRLFESRRQLPNQYAMKVDKASMSESVEARAPFLDRRVAEFAFRTPRAHLQHAGENKFVLRELARRHRLLPDAIANRAKFGAPLASSWIDRSEALRRFAAERILRPNSVSRGLGFESAMRAYFEQGVTGQKFPGAISIYSNLAWRLLLLEQWAAVTLARRAS
jgi:asparagine synthase (glutamine-hydrolysing)